MLKIEKAKYEDAPVALEIRSAAILSQCASHYPPDMLKTWANVEPSDEFADSVEKNFYIAKYDNQIVGTGMIDIETGRIDAIFVHPDHIRKGIGKDIIKFLENLALIHGLKMVTLQSTLNAAEFYRACGFAGNKIETYTTSRGMSLDCIPMTKVIAQQGAQTDAKKRSG